MFEDSDPHEEYSIYQTRDKVWIFGRLSSIAAKLQHKSGEVVDTEGGSIWQVITIPRNIKHEVIWQIPPDLSHPLSQTQLEKFLKDKGAVLIASNVKALFGILKTAVGFVLVVVTKSDIVADFNSDPIYVVQDHMLIPLVYKSRLTRDETRCRNLIALTDINGNCFFSLRYSLFRNWQSNLLFKGNKNALSDSFETQMNYGYRYLWNAHALQPLINSIKQSISTNQSVTTTILKRCLVPFICGYVSCFSRKIPASSSSILSPQPLPTGNMSSPESPNSYKTSQQESLDEGQSRVIETANELSGNVLLTYLLISRRCTYFAGTRYFRRGMNATGDVANEVETEQILSISKDASEYNTESSAEEHRPWITSYVQYRGSIPLYWHHINLLSPMPGIVLEETPASVSSNVHWDRLEATYGKCIHVVNLLRQSPSHREGVLHTAYHNLCEEVMSSASYRRLNYVAFDLLKEGKDHLSDLVESLTQMVYETGVCTLQASLMNSHHPSTTSAAAEEEEMPLSKEDNPLLQHGIIRTNCVDCLDRTNLAQFLAARVAVIVQLEALQVLSASAPSCNRKSNSNVEEEESTNKEDLPFVVSDEDLAFLQSNMLRLWTAHGDRIALQYAGSSAMHRMHENNNSKPASGKNDHSHKSENKEDLSENTDIPHERTGKEDIISEEQVDISTYFHTTTTPLILPSGLLKGELVTDLDTVDLVSGESPVSSNGQVHALSTTLPSPPPLMLKTDTELIEDTAASSTSSTSGTSPASGPNPSSHSSSKASNKSTLSTSAAAVDTSKLTMVSNLASNAVISIQRYFLNISSDCERQYAFDYLLGNSAGSSSSSSTVSEVWKASPYPENNRSDSKTLATDSTIRALLELEYLP